MQVSIYKGVSSERMAAIAQWRTYCTSKQTGRPAVAYITAVDSKYFTYTADRVSDESISIICDAKLNVASKAFPDQTRGEVMLHLFKQLGEDNREALSHHASHMPVCTTVVPVIRLVWIDGSYYFARESKHFEELELTPNGLHFISQEGGRYYEVFGKYRTTIIGEAEKKFDPVYQVEAFFAPDEHEARKIAHAYVRNKMHSLVKYAAAEDYVRVYAYNIGNLYIISLAPDYIDFLRYSVHSKTYFKFNLWEPAPAGYYGATKTMQVSDTYDGIYAPKKFRADRGIHTDEQHYYQSSELDGYFSMKSDLAGDLIAPMLDLVYPQK